MSQEMGEPGCEITHCCATGRAAACADPADVCIDLQLSACKLSKSAVVRRAEPCRPILTFADGACLCLLALLSPAPLVQCRLRSRLRGCTEAVLAHARSAATHSGEMRTSHAARFGRRCARFCNSQVTTVAFNASARPGRGQGASASGNYGNLQGQKCNRGYRRGVGTWHAQGSRGYVISISGTRGGSPGTEECQQVPTPLLYPLNAIQKSAQ